MIEIDKPILELLDKLGFIEDVKSKGLYSTLIENGTAFIDFRKENGRRYANIEGKLISSKDADTVPILKTFKVERDKLLLSQDKAQEHNQPSIQPAGIPSNIQPPIQNAPAVEREKSPFVSDSKDISPEGVKSPPSPTNLYEFFYELVGAGGIIEIFGDTGSLKSQLCTETCKDARKRNKTFYYLDTEGKVGLHNKKELGEFYRYLPIWDEVIKTIKAGFPKYDLLIVDSIGFPISTEYADMKANEQGDSLQDMMAIVGKHLKAWAFKNDAIVIFTNQPKSTFMKSEEELKRLNPFGDKVHFAANIILKAEKTIIPAHLDQTTKRVKPLTSVGTLTSFRSPDFMDDVIMLYIRKNNNEIKVEVPGHVTKRLQELRE